MQDTLNAQRVFFDQTGMDQANVETMINNALHGAEDGELYLESSYSEGLQFDDHILKHASYNTSKGFGLRSVIGEQSAYAHSSILTHDSIARACSTVQSISSGQDTHIALDTSSPKRTNHHFYTNSNPLPLIDFSDKIALLSKIDHYVRQKDPLVSQVAISLSGSWQLIRIMRNNAAPIDDIRPLVRLNISTIVQKNGRLETGTYGMGGRILYDSLMTEESWKKAADRALKQALTNIESRPVPAGQLPVVLGPGWPGILLHEAIGHGLEGDFNRKKTSAFSHLMGQQVAAKGVTIVDDGTLHNRRGSLNVDDEGTPTSRTVLIEDGILKGYMQDRMNARLMGVNVTGNGRREGYEHQPLPRMTNTYMLAGNHSPEEIIASVKKGIYAVNFGGGQVDITSGKFVFSMSEAYMIENGKVTYPIKGATLIGHGPDVLTKIKMIGNDLQLDPGVGTCGKAGQGVPVGVGQPTLLIEGLTIGGTE